MSDSSVFFKVDKVEWEITTGAIRRAYWSIVAYDGVDTGVYSSKTDFEPNPESPEFLNIDSVTEESVISWVRSSIIDAQYEIYKARAIENLANKKLPPMVSGLPWKVN